MINQPEILEEAPQKEYTDEQNIKMANNIRFIANEILSIIPQLPDDIVLKHLSKPDRANEVLKPITNQLYANLAKQNVSIKDIKDSMDLLQNVVRNTTRRIANYLDETIAYINFNKYGTYDPEVDIAIGDWEVMRKEVAQKNADLSTDKTEETA